MKRQPATEHRIEHFGAGERGSLLVTTMGIIIVASMAAIGTVTYVQHGIQAVRTAEHFTKAHYVARAAMNMAMRELSADGNLLAARTLEAPTTGTLGGVEYTLVYTALADGTTRLDSVASCRGSEAVLRLYASVVGGIEGIFAKSMLSDHDIVLADAATVQNGGDVHSNSNVTAYDSVHLSGDMTAVGIADATTATVEGAVLSGAPHEDFPLLDYDYYFNIAQANGQILSGDQKFTAAMSPITPPGGILWVNGNVVIGDNVVINGSIIATGDITRSSDPALVFDAGGVDLFAQNNLNIPADIAFLASGHTNANLSVTGDTAGSAGTITYVGTAKISSTSVHTLQTGPEPMPQSPLTLEELKTVALASGSYFVGDILLKEATYGVRESFSGRLVNNGSVIYATGKITIDDNNFRRDVSLVSETSDVIVLSTEKVTMMPGQNVAGILIYAKKSIDLRGNSVEVGGILLAETGNFYFMGDENGRAAEGSFWCGGTMTIAGDRVDLGNISGTSTDDETTTDPTAYVNAPTLADGTVAPALVSLNGNISIVDAINVTGLIYTGSGTFSSTTAAAKDYRGAIYSRSELQFSGNSDLIFDESYVQIGQGLVYEPPTLDKLAFER